jgi:Flp pilus assembly pilin Flp
MTHVVVPPPARARGVMSFRRVVNFVANLIADDRGQDLIEYAVITTFISVASVILMVVIVVLMGAGYGNWITQIQAAWEPGAPCGC